MQQVFILSFLAIVGDFSYRFLFSKGITETQLQNLVAIAIAWITALFNSIAFNLFKSFNIQLETCNYCIC